jgi:hypothetical protein
MGAYRQFLGLQNPQMQQMGAQTGQPSGQQNWDQASFQQQFGSPKTPQELIALEPQLQQAGIKVLRNAEGTAGKIELPNGHIVDVIQNAGVGGGNFQWLSDNGIRGFGGGPGQNFDFGALATAIPGLEEFARTGGFSDQDIQNIRGRSNAPIKAIYQNAQDELNRSKALAGGRMTNYGAAAAKLAREASYAAGDQSLNTEGLISELRNRGRQFGISGAGQLGLGLRGQGLQGFSGMGNLYGTTPGLTNMFGNQVLQSAGQGIDIGQLRNQLAQSRVNAQLGRANMPDRWDTTKKIIGLGSDLATGIGTGMDVYKQGQELFG